MTINKNYEPSNQIKPLLKLCVVSKIIRSSPIHKATDKFPSSLTIETGRYTRPISPRNERCCKNCNNHTIGDEKHFLFSCKSYSSQRNQLFQELAECSDILNREDFSPFFKLMNYNQGDVQIASILCRDMSKVAQ